MKCGVLHFYESQSRRHLEPKRKLSQSRISLASLSARIFLLGSLLLPLLGLHAFKTLSRYYYEKIVLDDVG